MTPAWRVGGTQARGRGRRVLGRLALAFLSSLRLHSSEKEERSQQALADTLGIQLLFWQLQRQGPNTHSAKAREAGSLSQSRLPR